MSSSSSSSNSTGISGSINIKYWDPSKIRSGAVVLIIGRRGSGKSTVAQDVLSYHRNLKRGVCVSATERANPFWNKHIPQCFIHNEYNDKITADLFDMQKRCKEKLGYAEPAFAIFDDLLFDKTFVRSKLTRQIAMNGRHFNIFTIITCQFITDVSPDIRSNIDYVIVLRDNIKVNRERVYLFFAGMFPTFGEFDQTMMSCTQNNECLVIDQTALSYKIEDCVFFYKATPDLRYRVGAPCYWEYSAAHKTDDDRDDHEEGGQKTKIRVRKHYPPAPPRA